MNNVLFFYSIFIKNYKKNLSKINKNLFINNNVIKLAKENQIEVNNNLKNYLYNFISMPIEKFKYLSNIPDLKKINFKSNYNLLPVHKLESNYFKIYPKYYHNIGFISNLINKNICNKIFIKKKNKFKYKFNKIKKKLNIKKRINNYFNFTMSTNKLFKFKKLFLYYKIAYTFKKKRYLKKKQIMFSNKIYKIVISNSLSSIKKINFKYKYNFLKNIVKKKYYKKYKKYFKKIKNKLIKKIKFYIKKKIYKARVYRKTFIRIKK